MRCASYRIAGASTGAGLRTGGGNQAAARRAVARVSDDHEGAPRFAVSSRHRASRSDAARARRLWTLLAFASRPPPLAATWRARFGLRLGCARSRPETPRRPPGSRLRRHDLKMGSTLFRRAVVGDPVLHRFRLFATCRRTKSASDFSCTGPSCLSEVSGFVRPSLSKANL